MTICTGLGLLVTLSACFSGLIWAMVYLVRFPANEYRASRRRALADLAEVMRYLYGPRVAEDDESADMMSRRAWAGFSIMPPHVLYTVTDAGAAAVKSMMAAHQRLRESDNEGGNL